MDYSWFEASICEKKRYRFSYTSHLKYLEHIDKNVPSSDELPTRSWFRVTRRNPYEQFIEVEGSHAMNPGVPSGALEIERAFNIKLDEDIHVFYRNWGGGFLMLSEMFYILTPAQVVAFCRRLRTTRKEPLDEPWRVVRFCNLDDNNFVALDLNENKWRVIYAHSEYDDAMLMNENVVTPYVLGTSFSDWLRRTIEGDGELPKGLGSPWYPEGPATYERLA